MSASEPAAVLQLVLRPMSRPDVRIFSSTQTRSVSYFATVGSFILAEISHLGLLQKQKAYLLSHRMEGWVLCVPRENFIVVLGKKEYIRSAEGKFLRLPLAAIVLA